MKELRDEVRNEMAENKGMSDRRVTEGGRDGTKEGIQDEGMEAKAGGGGGEIEDSGDGWMYEGTRMEGFRMRDG